MSKTKAPKYKCNTCKDTGVIRYKKIDEGTHYRWVPWLTRKCTKCGGKP